MTQNNTENPRNRINWKYRKVTLKGNLTKNVNAQNKQYDAPKHP